MGKNKKLLPPLLSFFTFFFLSCVLILTIQFLNHTVLKGKILLSLRPRDIAIGFFIYVKTSIDFAIFIGKLMQKNIGTKNRISIESGTAVGNAAGTILILCIWSIFKEVRILLIAMVFISCIVLLQMASESITETDVKKVPVQFLQKLLLLFFNFLEKLTSYIKPFTGKLLPKKVLPDRPFLSPKHLLFFSFTIPFILGLDDFAGYIPLFSIVNVFGFSIGVFAGHMLLTNCLFLKPQRTMRLVENTYVVIIGSLFLFALAIFGFFEIAKLSVSF